MKWIKLIAFTFVLFACKTEHVEIKEPIVLCSINKDTLYHRLPVLQIFADVLNENAVYKRFGVNEKGSGKGFQIYDLVDTTNVQRNSNECIYFYNNHVYHFVSILLADSYSSIAYLDNGNIKIFKSINCNGDKIDNVIAYLEIKLANSPNKDEIISRVINYRKYGRYVKMCNYDYLRDCGEHWSE